MKTKRFYTDRVPWARAAGGFHPIAALLFLLALPILAGCPAENGGAQAGANASDAAVDGASASLDNHQANRRSENEGGDEFDGDDGESHDGDGHDPDLIAVCHVPRNNAAAAHTIYISPRALDAHLAHGDTLGPCGGSDEEGTGEEEGMGEEGQGEEGTGEEGMGEEGQGEEGMGEEVPNTSFQAVFEIETRPTSFSSGLEFPVSITDLTGVTTQSWEYLVVGSAMTDSANGDPGDIVVARYDATGMLVDQFSYGGFQILDTGSSVALAPDGGWAIAGATGSFADQNGYVVRTYPTGGVQYQIVFGGGGFDRADDIKTTSDGGFIILGTTNLESAGGNVYMTRLNARGQTLWDRTFGYGTEEADSVVQLTDGSFAVVGTTTASGDKDVYLLHVDAAGNAISETTYGYGGTYESGTGIVETSDGGLVLSGVYRSTEFGVPDVYALRLDAMGNVMWENTYGTSQTESCEGVAANADGGFALAGMTATADGTSIDMYLLVLDADGVVVFDNAFGGPNIDSAHDIKSTSDGGYLLSGFTQGLAAAGPFSAYVVKTDANGQLIVTP